MQTMASSLNTQARNIVFELPIKVVSEMNWRGHWAERHKRFKIQKDITFAHCLKSIGYRKERKEKYLVTLIRILGYKQRKYDGDNLQSSFKAVRDGIATYFGIDDGSERIEWRYEQEKGDMPGVRVEIREKHDANVSF